MQKNVIVCDRCKLEEDQGIPTFDGSNDEVQRQLTEHLRNRRLWITVSIGGGGGPYSSYHHYCSVTCVQEAVGDQFQKTKLAQETNPTFGMVVGASR